MIENRTGNSGLEDSGIRNGSTGVDQNADGSQIDRGAHTTDIGEPREVMEFLYQAKGDVSLGAILRSFAIGKDSDIIVKKGVFGNAYPGGGHVDIYVQTTHDARMSEGLVRARILYVDRGHGVEPNTDTSILLDEFIPNRERDGVPHYLHVIVEK